MMGNLYMYCGIVYEGIRVASLVTMVGDLVLKETVYCISGKVKKLK